MIVHYSDLGKYGVVPDVDPYDLPLGAWSFAANVRFRNNRVESGPVFRNIVELEEDEPRFIGSVTSSDGFTQTFIGYNNGTVTKFDVLGEDDYSISGYTPSTSDVLWTDTTLAGVYYVNRQDRVPWYLTSGDTAFVALGGGWNSGWRCRLLRTCGDALVALNVTKSGTEYPTMVKTSSIPTAGAIPSSWDHTDPATLATENILAQMRGPIVDASSIGETLFIYGYDQTFRMRADGSEFVYESDPLFEGRGAINANCSVEVYGRQYVFGPTDIWQHDGVSDTSICDGITRQFIFDALDHTKAHRCFVRFYPRLNEIRFHYRSGDDYIAFPNNGDGCNRCAVFNVLDKTWAFDDVPYVHAAVNSHVNSQPTYATVSGTYDTFGGAYIDYTESIKRSFLYVGEAHDAEGLTTSLYAFDAYGRGSSVLSGVDEVATKPRVLVRTGIDLEELGADLKGYKTASSVWPQARLDEGAEPLLIEVGSADYFGEEPEYTSAQTYTGTDAGDQIDPNSAGRWLAIRITHDDYHNMRLSRFDVDLVPGIGER